MNYGLIKNNNIVKLINKHISKDETRYHLTGIYFDHDKAVATDGHRMIVVNLEENLNAGLKAFSEDKLDRIFNPKTKELFDIQHKYPNYKALLPKLDNGYKKLFVDIPTWFKDIKTSKKNNPVWLSLFGFQCFPKDAIASYNAAYLAPYAGIELDIYFKDKNTPLVLKNTEFTAVIMPVRL